MNKLKKIFIKIKVNCLKFIKGDIGDASRNIYITFTVYLILILYSIFTYFHLILDYENSVSKNTRYYSKHNDRIINYVVYLSLFISYICIQHSRRIFNYLQKENLPKNYIEKYQRKVFFKNGDKISFIIFITILECVSLTILKYNNLYGIVYKDFNCEKNNYLQFFNDSNSDLKCKKNKLNYNFTKDEYPNKWINPINSKIDYKKIYCQEYLDFEKFIYYGKSEYQSYPLIKNDYLNKKHFLAPDYKNKFYGKYRNEVLITQKKIFIKDKKEAKRCIPSKYIKNNYIVINITGMSYGHVKCKKDIFKSVRPIKFNYTNLYNKSLEINHGFVQPEYSYFVITILYTIIYCFSYKLVVYYTLVIIEKKNSDVLKKLVNEKKTKKIEIIFEKYLKISKLLFKIIWFLLFYFYDLIVNNLCDLNDGKFECYINYNTINSFLGFYDLRPNKCEGTYLYADNYNIESLIQFIYIVPVLIISIVCFPYKKKDAIPTMIIPHCIVQAFVAAILNICLFWGIYILIIVCGLIGSAAFLLFLIVNNLYVVYYFFITIVDPTYWSMYRIKIPSFESFHIDLGILFNKNIYNCIKSIYFMMMIYDDLKGIYYYSCKKQKNQSNEIKTKEIEMKETIEEV
jgi:hypothetical protein